MSVTARHLKMRTQQHRRPPEPLVRVQRPVVLLHQQLLLLLRTVPHRAARLPRLRQQPALQVRQPAVRQRRQL
jgi:hypothetical protein